MELAPVSTGLDVPTGAWIPEGGGSLAIEVSEEKAAAPEMGGLAPPSLPAVSGGDTSEAPEWPELRLFMTAPTSCPKESWERSFRERGEHQ